MSADEFTDEQKELYSKPTILIQPAFNGEWIIETRTENDELEGRGIATNNIMLIEMIRAALGKDTEDDSPNFEAN